MLQKNKNVKLNFAREEDELILQRSPIMILLGLALNLSACGTDDNYGGEAPTPPENVDKMKLKITIGAKSYTATLYDNAMANEFKAMLPMTLNMSEHDRNEKYFDLPNRLTTTTSNPRTVNNGDLMCIIHYDLKKAPHPRWTRCFLYLF